MSMMNIWWNWEENAYITEAACNLWKHFESTDGFALTIHRSVLLPPPFRLAQIALSAPIIALGLRSLDNYDYAWLRSIEWLRLYLSRQMRTRSSYDDQ